MAARRERAKDVRTNKSARFETDFGEPIRDELRNFEKELRTLRVFTFPAGTAPQQRVTELTEYRAAWDKAAVAVEALLREADDSPAVDADYWGDTWQENITRADAALQQVMDMAEPTDADVRRAATEALGLYKVALDHARSGIATEREKLAPTPPSTLGEWIRQNVLGRYP